MTRPTSCCQPLPSLLRGAAGSASAVGDCSGCFGETPMAPLLDGDCRFILERKRRDEQGSVARRAVDGDLSAECFDPVLQTNEARAPTAIDSADAVVANRQPDPAV